MSVRVVSPLLRRELHEVERRLWKDRAPGRVWAAGRAAVHVVALFGMLVAPSALLVCAKLAGNGAALLFGGQIVVATVYGVLTAALIWLLAIGLVRWQRSGMFNLEIAVGLIGVLLWAPIVWFVV